MDIEEIKNILSQINSDKARYYVSNFIDSTMRNTSMLFDVLFKHFETNEEESTLILELTLFPKNEVCFLVTSQELELSKAAYGLGFEKVVSIKLTNLNGGIQTDHEEIYNHINSDLNKLTSMIDIDGISLWMKANIDYNGFISRVRVI